MNINLRTIALLMISMGFSNISFANLEEAASTYKNVLNVPPGSKFANSPYLNTYVRSDASSFTLFDKSMTVYGYQQSWYIREDARKPSVEMNFNQAEGIKSFLIKNVKTDWMVNAGYGTGGKNIIVISAPNCPLCKIMEADMSKAGNSIPASIYIVPTLLGKGSAGFRNAVMCSQDPDSAWKNSFKSSAYQTSNSDCEKSRWAEIVIDNTFPSVNGYIRVSTPSIILPNGTVIKGWGGKKTIDAIKQNLL